MTTEQELHERLHHLVAERNQLINDAKAIIKGANEYFDSEATKINRQLRKFHHEDTGGVPTEKKTVKKGPPKKPRFTEADGFTAEEIAHADSLRNKGTKSA